MDLLTRHRVTLSGPAHAPPVVFAPGYGQYQRMWRHVAPAFEADHRVVLFDVIGADQGVAGAYPAPRYSTLHGHAADLVALGRELDLRGATLVGHSVGAMIGLLAVNAEPERYERRVLIGASPRYLDDDGYHGGFSLSDINELLDAIDGNYVRWAAATAPAATADPERPELAAEVLRGFERTDAGIAAQFARATFLSDHRAELGTVRRPTLILQTRADLMVPADMGEYLRARIPGSRFEMLDSEGHYPHLSAPGALITAIRRFLAA